MANEHLSFFGWQRPGASAGMRSEGGRLRGSVTFHVQSRELATEQDERRLSFEYLGPRDVTGFLPGAVAHVWPSPGATDAEETMCAYVELAAPDLPWRYAPEGPGPRPADPAPPSANGWRPWLALVVGPTHQVLPQPGGKVWIAAEVLAKHRLADAWRWTHVQRTEPAQPGAGAHLIARIVSPYDMQPNTDYLAVVVPAYADDGSLRWAAAAPEALLPVYHSWRFRTGEKGDFKDLALRLKARRIDDPALAVLGRSEVEYPLAARANVVMARGALVPPAAVPANGDDPDGPVPFDVAASVQAMRLPETDAEGRHVVQLPRYGDAWVTDPLTPPGGWGVSLNDHPRHRVAAGLGLWLGVVEQQLIAQAAADRAAGVFIAAQKIRGLLAGLAAAGTLWTRRLPPTPAARLALFGPALARVLAADAGGAVTVRDAISDRANGRGNGRPLPPAVFSSAARRLLRPGTARARRAQPGALDPSRILAAANDCARLTPARRPSEMPPGVEPLSGAPHADTLAAELGAGAQQDVVGEPDTQRFFNQLQQAGIDPALLRGLSRSRWAEFLRAAVPLDGGPPDRDAIARLREEDARHPDDEGTGLGGWREMLRVIDDHQPRRPRCRPVDLGALDAALVDAFRPHRGGVAARRVLDSITGLDPAEPFAPPEICPDLDLPAWAFVRDKAPEWLLFGRDAIQPDDVVAVASNPRFVNACLVGLNTQTLRELRWRNIPVRTGCTPLRRFWGRLTPVTAGVETRPSTDIKGIHLWAIAQPLGHPDHATDPKHTRQLVMVFKTALFRRYPRTLVYLSPATIGANGKPDWEKDATFSPITHPVFCGEIEKDLVFFGFPVPPETLKESWVVVEEPPPGYRFDQGRIAAGVANAGIKDGGAMAAAIFAQPTRVLFRGDAFLETAP
jgi:hypothetical protein